MRPDKRLTAFSLSLVFLITFSAACSKKDPSVAIGKLIKKGTELAEQHKSRDLMKLTTENFSAHSGAYDKNHVRGILFAAFKHYGRFKVLYPSPSVDISEDGNTAQAVIYVTIFSQDKPIPGLKDLYNDPEKWLEAASEKADLYQLELDLIIEDKDWKVRTAEIEGYKGWGF